MIQPALALRDVTLGFGRRALLSGASFDVPARGVTAIMGPAGVGKSTFLRMLARRAEQLPAFWHRGAVLARGADLLTEWDARAARRHVALLAQKARLYTASVADNAIAAIATPPLTLAAKRALASGVLASASLTAALGDRLDAPAVSLPLGLQRRLSLARIAAADPAVVLADEPERDLPAADARALLDMLVDQAERRAVLLVTHDQTVARQVARRVVLFLTGRVAFQGTRDELFDGRHDPVVERYLRTGNCWPFGEEAGVADGQAVPEPSAFRWIIPHALAGMARPGLLAPARDDLASIQSLGVTRLVCLERHWTSADGLAELGIAGAHVPIVDMRAPALADALALCRAIREWLRDGEVVAVHCKAGLGRTGTVLAAYLVYDGMDALQALEDVRAVCHLYVQSTEQVEFLHDFERYCRDQNSVPQGAERSSGRGAESDRDAVTGDGTVVAASADHTKEDREHGKAR